MSRRKKSEYRKSLEFAVILAVLGLAFGAVSMLRHHGMRAWVFAGAGLAALALALVARPFWLFLFRSWMKLAEGVGWVMTRVILTLFYFLVLTPFGVFRRLTGNPTLDTAWRDRKPSYWIAKETVPASIERYGKRY